MAADVAIPMLPLLGVQAWRVRRATPRLPPAAGPNRGCVAGARPLHVVLLGESPVDGVGAPDHEQALGGNLAGHLARSSGRGVRWVAIGRNGMTARKALGTLIPLVPRERADLLIIALGVNDSMILTRPGRWARDVRQLILRARARLGQVPVVLSAVPPIEKFPVLPQPLAAVLGLRGRALDAALRALARRMENVRHVPLHGDASPEHFCEDGFHPSPLGYARWAEILVEGGRGFFAES
ncbi:MAG: SGNH/GDSL hydrolase family protein [Armatimonadetes bacterium]|nr:SGNH/GDSL hydrolase family protein [Armatimonadota bacterium]